MFRLLEVERVVVRDGSTLVSVVVDDSEAARAYRVICTVQTASPTSSEALTSAIATHVWSDDLVERELVDETLAEALEGFTRSELVGDVRTAAARALSALRRKAQIADALSALEARRA